jgi:hypothetical protein
MGWRFSGLSRTIGVISWFFGPSGPRSTVTWLGLHCQGELVHEYAIVCLLAVQPECTSSIGCNGHWLSMSVTLRDNPSASFL